MLALVAEGQPSKVEYENERADKLQKIKKIYFKRQKLVVEILIRVFSKYSKVMVKVRFHAKKYGKHEKDNVYCKKLLENRCKYCEIYERKKFQVICLW